MNRRDLLRGGMGMLAAGLGGRVFAAVPCPPVLDGGQASTCGVPTGVGAVWTWNVPSLQDETALYTDVLGWSIPSSARSFTDLGRGGYTWSSHTSWGFGDIHNDTEGDALWAWDQQYKRYGEATAVGNGSSLQDWRAELLADYKSGLLTELDSDDGDGAPSGFGYDHIYGQGLAVIYHDTGDSEILSVLDGLKARIKGRARYQAVASGTPIATSYYLARGYARWAIVAAYCAEATGDPDWRSVRDALAFGYETSTDWQEGGSIADGGCYFASSAQSGYDGISDYSGGRRYNSSFSLGLCAEALWRLYIQTGSETLKDRLIKMARYVRHYAHDPSWAYPFVGSRFGHNGDGTRWGNGGAGTATSAGADCSYNMSLVNLMVFGYKLTGESTMLDFAKKLFTYGNRWDPGGSRDLWAQSLDHVHKYLDTQCDPSRTEFQFNKGALQYCYMLLENGGRPEVVG